MSGAGSAGTHIALKRLTAYREGALSEAESEEVQEHLSLCPRCARLLLELRDFEAAAAGEVEPGPESLREEAWAALSRRLAPPPLAAPPPARAPRGLYALAAALLLAVAGLALWSAVTVGRERQRLATLEQRLEEREEALAENGRQLEAARRQVRELQGRPDGRRDVAELTARIDRLTAEMEALRRAPSAVADGRVGLSAVPRFVLRGQEETAPLRGGGAANRVSRAPGEDRFRVALDLDGHPMFDEYRLELLDRGGAALWSGRLRAGSLLGDAGAWVSVSGLGTGRYRLRVEGLRPDRTELLAEYVLEVE